MVLRFFMQFSQKERQPFRLWYEYLQECLKHPKLFKVNKDVYKSWHLDQVKKLRFDAWLKEHSHLFAVKEKGKIEIYNGKNDDNSILVSIPKHMNVQEIQRSIGSVVKGKVNVKEAKFNITSNKNFIEVLPFDVFLWSWQFKQMKKYQGRGGLGMIWEAVNDKRKTRQAKVQKQVEKNIFRKRNQIGGDSNPTSYTKNIISSRNIKKAQRILENVSKGIFPGDYSDH